MTTTTPDAPATTPASDEQLVRLLVERAGTTGTSLLGPDGLLQKLTKLVLETGLDAEMSEHLDYDKHDPMGRNRGNSRNGARAKTVLTEAGPVEVAVPRDRDGSFDPKLVRKHQRRLTGIEDLVVSLSAKGLTTGEVSPHLQEIYGAQVSKETISRITDQVMDGVPADALRLSAAAGRRVVRAVRGGAVRGRADRKSGRTVAGRRVPPRSRGVV